MSKEIRVALLAIVAIGATFWGFNFIIGNNLFTKTNLYYAEYANVGGLKTSTPVRINGVQVGRVAEVSNQLDKQNVLVRFDLNPDIRIPKNTYAYILNETFMGQQAVELRYEVPCSGDDCAKSGDFIRGENLSVLASTISRDELKNYMTDFKATVLSLLDTLNGQMLGDEAQGPIANTIRDLESTMGNLKNSTGQLNSLLARSSNDISSSLDNVEKITGNLADNNEKINKVLANTEAFTDQLSVIDLKSTVDELAATLSSLNKAIDKADTTFDGLNGVVGSIQNGDGTLGKLFNDPELYNEITTLSAKADSLMNDIQGRPYRYIPLKGRNRIKRYDRKDAQEDGNQ